MAAPSLKFPLTSDDSLVGALIKWTSRAGGCDGPARVLKFILPKKAFGLIFIEEDSTPNGSVNDTSINGGD
jgi:hypothetical protein